MLEDIPGQIIFSVRTRSDLPNTPLRAKIPTIAKVLGA